MLKICEFVAEKFGHAFSDVSLALAAVDGGIVRHHHLAGIGDALLRVYIRELYMQAKLGKPGSRDASYDKLQSNKSLANVSRRIGLVQFCKCSSDHRIGDVFEAVIGAVFLDSGRCYTRVWRRYWTGSWSQKSKTPRMTPNETQKGRIVLQSVCPEIF